MKKSTFLYFALILLFACTTSKNSIASGETNTVDTVYPPEAECTLEVIKDKSLSIKTDDTGHLYYNLKDMPGKTVFKYTFKKITDPKLQDAGYSEVVIFESDGNANLNYTGKDIQKTNMLFSVQCFCRGKAGVYKVESGTVTYSNKKLHLELPQIVDAQATKKVTISHK